MTVCVHLFIIGLVFVTHVCYGKEKQTATSPCVGEGPPNSVIFGAGSSNPRPRSSQCNIGGDVAVTWISGDNIWFSTVSKWFQPKGVSSSAWIGSPVHLGCHSDGSIAITFITKSGGFGMAVASSVSDSFWVLTESTSQIGDSPNRFRLGPSKGEKSLGIAYTRSGASELLFLRVGSHSNWEVDPANYSVVHNDVAIRQFAVATSDNGLPGVAYSLFRSPPLNILQLRFALNDEIDGSGTWRIFTVPAVEEGEFEDGSLADLDLDVTFLSDNRAAIGEPSAVYVSSSDYSSWSTITVDSYNAGIGVSLAVVGDFLFFAVSSGAGVALFQIDVVAFTSIKVTPSVGSYGPVSLSSVNSRPALALTHAGSGGFAWRINSLCNGTGSWGQWPPVCEDVCKDADIFCSDGIRGWAADGRSCTRFVDSIPGRCSDKQNNLCYADDSFQFCLEPYRSTDNLPSVVVASCGSSECIRPAACAAGDHRENNDETAEICFTSMNPDEGNCGPSMACDSSGSCVTLPPVAPTADPPIGPPDTATQSRAVSSDPLGAPSGSLVRSTTSAAADPDGPLSHPIGTGSGAVAASVIVTLLLLLSLGVGFAYVYVRRRKLADHTSSSSASPHTHTISTLEMAATARDSNSSTSRSRSHSRATVSRSRSHSRMGGRARALSSRRSFQQQPSASPPAALRPEPGIPFDPTLSRTQAEQMVSKQPPGFFVVRPSSIPSRLTVTYRQKSDGSVVHTQVLFSNGHWHMENGSQQYDSVGAVLQTWKQLNLDSLLAQRGQNNYSTILPQPVRAADNIIPLSDVKKVKLLGAGAFGEVWHCEWKSVDVAMKQIKGADSGAARDQLSLEVDRLSSLRNHPNVVTFYGIIEDPLSVLIEYCPGGSLDEAVYGNNPQHFSESELLSIVRGIASGVAHLHASNIIHRDLAARNILLGHGNIAKVTDFGMSRVQTSDYQKTASTMGPIRWMSPEQLSKSIVSKESDMWSFGVVLFEIYAKQTPWEGLTNVETAQRVMAGGCLSIPTNAPSDIADIMRRCFQFVPADRLTAMAVVEALGSVHSYQSAPRKANSPFPVASGSTTGSEHVYVDPPFDSSGYGRSPGGMGVYEDK